MSSIIHNIIINHVMAEPGVVALVAVCIARIDSAIIFALRFFPPQTIKDELDRLDALAKAEVDKDAANNMPPK